MKVLRTARWLAVCAAMAAGVSACGGDESSGGDSPKSAGDSAKVLLLSVPPGDDFTHTLQQGAQREAKRLGVDLEVQQVSSTEASAQVSALNAGVATNPDAILINPFDAKALQTPLERAASRGIKIITYDTTIGEPEGVVSTHVSSDLLQAGRSAAHELLRLIGSEGTVFYQGDATGVTFFDTIRDGWQEVMDAQPGIEQLPVVYSDYEPSKAQSQMETTLTAHPDVAGGFGSIFLDQQGITAALKRAGELGKVKVVALDGMTPNIQRLRDGAVQVLISWKPAHYGAAAVKAAVDAVNGEALPPKTVIGQCVLTAETVEDPKNADCVYDKAP